jgi:hypothetical protein
LLLIVVTSLVLKSSKSITLKISVMKAKAFILVCLFIGIGLTQVSAQNDKNGTDTNKFIREYGPCVMPVYCNGEISDLITCSNLFVEMKLNYIKGEYEWASNKVLTLEWISESTGEIYKGEVIFDFLCSEKDIAITHCFLIGNKVSNITQKITFNSNTWEIIDIQSNCN